MGLTDQVAAGLKWTAGLRTLTQIITWCGTLVVMRLLSPSDYGLMALASFFVMLFGFVADVGLGSALVQAPEIDKRSIQEAFGVILLVNLGIILVLMGGAPLVARVANEPRLTSVVRALALMFVPAAVSVVPESLLKRELRFRPLSVIEFSGALAGTATTLGLALAGAGVWTLVAGTLVIATWKAVGFNLLTPVRCWPSASFEKVRRFLNFGGRVTASGMLWQLYSDADLFFAGRFLGATATGFYAVSKQLATMPLERISQVFNQVMYSAFARLQHEPKRVAAQWIRSVQLVSFVILPIAWGMSCVARDAVSVVLGSRWAPAVLPLQLICLAIPFRLVAGFATTVAQSRGRADITLRIAVVSSVVMPAAFLIGCRYGIVGLSLVWVLVYPWVLVFSLRLTLGVIGLRLRDVALAMRPALAVTLAMVLAVLAVSNLTAATDRNAVRLALTVMAGVLTYAVLSLVFNRGPLGDILLLARGGSPQGAGEVQEEAVQQ